jgi:hypothetical protein
MKIGTSLGKCVKSILDGDVAYEDVLFIVSNTDGPTEDRLRDIMEEYYYGAPRPDYDMRHHHVDDVVQMAIQLFQDGKLFQPRMFIKSGWGNAHRLQDTWYDIMPTESSSEAAKNAWDAYVMMSKLSQ